MELLTYLNGDSQGEHLEIYPKWLVTEGPPVLGVFRLNIWGPSMVCTLALV